MTILKKWAIFPKFVCDYFFFFTCMSYLYPGSIMASTTVFNSRSGFESLPGFLRETFTIYWWREMVKSMNYVTKWFIFDSVWIWFYTTIGNTPWNNFTPHFALFLLIWTGGNLLAVSAVQFHQGIWTSSLAVEQHHHPRVVQFGYLE